MAALALKSPLDIQKVEKTTTSLNKGILNSNKNIKKVYETISENVKAKKDSYTQIKSYKEKRFEYERRKQSEDELESPNVVIQPGGPFQLIQSDTYSGFFDRILGFIGYLSAGWVLNNLSTFIGMGKEFIARIQKTVEIMTKFLGGTIDLFRNFGGLLGSLGQNIMTFDFFDSSKRLRNSLDQLNTTMGGLGNQIEEAFGLVTTPLTQPKYSGAEIPEFGTQVTGEGAYEKQPPSGSLSRGGRWKPLLDLIASVESSTDKKNNGYDAQNGAPRGVRPGLSQMTIGEIARNAPGASGRYQQMPEFLLQRAKDAGYNEKTIFTPAVQDVLAIKLIEKRGGNQWLAGKMSNESFMQGLANEWAALPNASGNFSYSGQRSYLKPNDILSALNKVKKSSEIPATRPETSIKQVPIPKNKIKPTITGRYDKEGKFGRIHHGDDLAMPSGTPLRAISDGEIIDSDYHKGWGYFLIMVDDKGIHHLYGHMLPGYKKRGKVKKGEVIGSVGSTGRSTGPHLHWEAGTGWTGYQITNKFSPLNRYSANAPFYTEPETNTSPRIEKPRQVPAAPISKPNISNQSFKQNRVVTPPSNKSNASPPVRSSITPRNPQQSLQSLREIDSIFSVPQTRLVNSEIASITSTNSLTPPKVSYSIPRRENEIPNNNIQIQPQTQLMNSEITSPIILVNRDESVEPLSSPLIKEEENVNVLNQPQTQLITAKAAPIIPTFSTNSLTPQKISYSIPQTEEVIPDNNLPNQLQMNESQVINPQTQTFNFTNISQILKTNLNSFVPFSSDAFISSERSPETSFTMIPEKMSTISQEIKNIPSIINNENVFMSSNIIQNINSLSESGEVNLSPTDQEDVNINPSPVKMSSPEKSKEVPSSITPERRGQDIVVIQNPSNKNIIISNQNESANTMPQISDFDMLNNFIKNKLLLDMAYL